VDDAHRLLAQLGLQVAGEHGFALAGGYAVQAHGIVERPSKDVDLFEDWTRRDEFDIALAKVIDAYQTAGFEVEIPVRSETFARLLVKGPALGPSTHTVELSADWRGRAAVQLDIGPVLHVEDAMAAKMSALYGRFEARDFIDVDAAIVTGRFERQRLLSLAEAADAGFDRKLFASSLAAIDRHDDEDFASYGLSAEEVEALRGRFGGWRVELLDGDGPSSTR
jgi:hypothetical protein